MYNRNEMSRYDIYVKTADKIGAGSRTGHVRIRLHDGHGNSSDVIKLSHLISSNFQEGTTDKFPVPKSCQLEEISKIELWKEGDGAKPDWFCDLIYIMDKHTGCRRNFPIHCLINPDLHYYILENYTSLPQDEPFPDQRRGVLCQVRESYVIGPRVPGIPIGVTVLPPGESFSNDYDKRIRHQVHKMTLKAVWAKLTLRKLESLKDFFGFYEGLLFQKPKSVDFNSLTDDLAFGAQRLIGCNPTQIELCTHIPSKFAVTDEMVQEHLEGMTLNEAMSANRLFITDYAILKDLPLEEGSICAPIGLFFLAEDDALMPIAIQLYQDPCSENPVFTPSDPTYTWQCAKLWFNHADASLHQSLTHLGLTHLLMEGIACAAHRQLAPQHPIFRLLAPHFLFLLGVNWSAMSKLLSEGGWVSQTMTVGVGGFYEIIRRGIKAWRIDVEGTLPNAVKERGVLSPRVLKHYPYRDDAMLYYNAIHKYVTTIIDVFYEKPSTILDDHELQAWAEELSRSCDEGGVEIQGIPNGGRFETADDIVMVCTSIIFTCSVQHAAVNFPQYDQYGFPQNYPGFLRGKPPKDNAPLSETDLLGMHPGIDKTLAMITVTKVLSEKGTKSLGDWEMRYQYDPRAITVEEEFKRDLGKISKVIERRNKMRPPVYQYHILNPDCVPNSISI